MTPTKVVGVRLPRHQAEELARYCRARGLTPTELLRKLISAHLADERGR